RATKRSTPPPVREVPETLLKAFCSSRRITSIELARESGVSRQHLGRVMSARMNPRRDVIAAIVSALRRMTLEPVRADDIFELTAENEAAFHAQRSRVFDLRLRASSRARSFVDALSRLDAGKRLATVLRAKGTTGALPIIAALIVEARRLTSKNPEEAAAYAE